MRVKLVASFFILYGEGMAKENYIIYHLYSIVLRLRMRLKNWSLDGIL